MTNRFINKKVIRICFCFFLKFLADTCPFLGPLVPLFWISGDISFGIQSQSGFCFIHFFAEANVMYILRDPPLVLHLLASWWSVLSPHTAAEVRLLGSELMLSEYL